MESQKLLLDSVQVELLAEDGVNWIRKRVSGIGTGVSLIGTDRSLRYLIGKDRKSIVVVEISARSPRSNKVVVFRSKQEFRESGYPSDQVSAVLAVAGFHWKDGEDAQEGDVRPEAAAAIGQEFVVEI